MAFFYVFFKMGSAPLSPALREIKQLFCVQNLILYYIKQIDSMLPCICPVIDHRGRQNVVRTSVTHSAIASCATLLSLPHFDVICDLLLDRCTATWNLFVKWSTWEVWRALKKLELPSAIASGNSYASFVLSKLPACSI